MSDAVQTKTLSDGYTYSSFLFTNVSDGTGESDVTKIDVSGLAYASGDGANCRVAIAEAHFAVGGNGAVQIDFDGTGSNTALVVAGTGKFDFTDGFGMIDNDAAVPTGDINFTTVGFAADSTYSILLKVRKVAGYDRTSIDAV